MALQYAGFQGRRLAAAAFLWWLMASAAGTAAYAHDDGRLELRTQGSFFVGGERKFFPYTAAEETPPPGVFVPGHVVVNQMYVRYQIPSHRGRKPEHLPVIMVHGAAHSGATFESTPDGREGWNDDFLRNGFPVYLVDQVARGRSGFDASSLMQAKRTNDASLIPNTVIFPQESAWTAFRFGPSYGTFYPEVQFPKEAAQAYFAQMLPEFRAPLIVDDRLNVEALAQTLDKTGPAVLLTHSQSGVFGWNTALKRPALVKGLVAVEPRTCQIAAQDLPVIARIPVLIVFGDRVQESANWLPIFNDCRALVKQLTDLGGNATLLHLPEVGVYGNTHMMMLDKNSRDVARSIQAWQTRRVERGDRR